MRYGLVLASLVLAMVAVAIVEAAGPWERYEAMEALSTADVLYAVAVVDGVYPDVGITRGVEFEALDVPRVDALIADIETAIDARVPELRSQFDVDAWLTETRGTVLDALRR